MKADKSKMFPVPLSSISADAAAPFPIYIFLKRNDRMILVRLEGDALGHRTYERLLQEKHDELWIPRSHDREFQAYAQHVEKLKATKLEEKREQPEEQGGTLSAPPLDPALSLSSELAAKIKGRTLDPGAQKAVVDHAKSLLQQLKKEPGSGREGLAKLARALAELTDPFLSDPENFLFEGVKAMRSLQEPTDHSVFAGSFAATLAAASGTLDPLWIGNLVVAATFHDIGHSQIPGALLNKKIRTAEEEKEFRRHVELGVKLLQRSEDPFPEAVVIMVREHHEKADGTGYPYGLTEARIHTASKFLILANEFDNLCETLPIGQAFEKLREESPAGVTGQEILEKALREPL